MRVISFKVWGDYAHFRRHFTTSSPLTHSIPPPSALRGLVGALLGLPRKNYPEILSPEKSRFGIRLLTPVKKIRLGMNLMDTKDGSWALLDLERLRPLVKKDGHGMPRLHTQVRTEFLKDPAFEIFFHHTDSKLMDEVTDRLQEHRTVFTPYLGITECIANFEFLWDQGVEPTQGMSRIVSVFKMEDLNELKLQEGTGVAKEHLPVFINTERIREVSDEIVFNPYAGPITADIKGAFGYPNKPGETFAFVG